MRIVELSRQSGGRPPPVAALTEALRQDREFQDLTMAQVAYHLAYLKDGGLVPWPPGSELGEEALG